jgi:hypothetical protein
MCVEASNYIGNWSVFSKNFKRTIIVGIQFLVVDSNRLLFMWSQLYETNRLQQTIDPFFSYLHNDSSSSVL